MGVAMVGILERLGFTVDYNPDALCCGQPAFNAGHQEKAKGIARSLAVKFKPNCQIVCASGSCTAMVRNFYPSLFQGDRDEVAAIKMGENTFEFSEFLTKKSGLCEKISGTAQGRIGLHTSCHTVRELKSPSGPRQIMERISGIELIEVGADVCCGFGGLFCVKFKPIADAIARTRLEMFLDKGVDTIVSNDPGCIMHLRGEAEREGNKVKILHLTQFLADAMGVQTNF